MIHTADKQLKEAWQETFSRLPPDSKKALSEALEALRIDAAGRANHSWKRHKAPMALYWKVISVYAGHLKRSIK